VVNKVAILRTICGITFLRKAAAFGWGLVGSLPIWREISRGHSKTSIVRSASRLMSTRLRSCDVRTVVGRTKQLNGNEPRGGFSLRNSRRFERVGSFCRSVAESGSRNQADCLLQTDATMHVRTRPRSEQEQAVAVQRGDRKLYVADPNF
jgi:hypothetical protein